LEQKNLYLLDTDKTTIGILSNRMPYSLPFFDDLQERSLDDHTDTLTFSIPGDHPEAEKVTSDKYILYPNYEEGYKLYKIKEVKESTSGNQYFKEVYAVISAQDDLLRDVVRPVEFQSASLEEIIEHILEGTTWIAGSIADFGLKDYKIDDYPTKLEALVEVVKEFGGEIEFEYITKGTKVYTQQVSVYEELGEKTGKLFTYGKDVKGIERIEDTSKLITAIIAVGKDDGNGGKLTLVNYTGSVPSGYEKPVDADWLGSIEAAEKYGIDGEHIFGVYKDDKAQSVYELFDNALKVLKQYEKPLMTYKVDVALLEKLTGYDHMSVRIGDTIMVQDTSVTPALYVQARVRKLSRSLTNPLNDSVELGDYIPVIPPINKRIEDIQSKIRAKEEVWNKAEEIPAIQQTIAQLPTKEDLFSLPSQRLKVRYVRDYINGNSVNTNNEWVELQVWRKGVNLAQGITPTASRTLVNAQYVTDGVVDYENVAYTGSDALDYIEIDLGQVWDDVEFIKVWHYYLDGRTYNDHRVDVSEDGLTWIRLYSSTKNGPHQETIDGFIVPVNSNAILTAQHKTQTETVQRLEDLEDFKQSTEYTLTQKVDMNDYNATVQSLTNSIAQKANLDYVNGQLSTKVDFSQYQQELDEVRNNIAYKVEIFSTNGSVFKNGQINTVLQARVYQGTEDVTDQIDASRFIWTRISSDPAGDTAWNNAHSTGTKSITVTSADVNARATFNCAILA
jgi:phage minor structural protein